MSSPLADQVAIVTGGASGIGLGIVRALDRRGCRIVVASRNPERVEAAAAVCSNAFGVPECDVRQPKSIELLFDTALERFGRVDILVNSAGIARSAKSTRHVPSPVHGLEEDVWLDILDTNLRGTFLATRAAARLMTAQRSGQIVNISSARAGRRGMAYGAGYCASKMAAVALLQALAEEVRSQGVRVMSLLPDVVQTDMLSGTDLTSGGALQPDQVGEYVAELLSIPLDTAIDLPAILPLGGKRRSTRKRTTPEASS